MFSRIREIVPLAENGRNTLQFTKIFNLAAGTKVEFKIGVNTETCVSDEFSYIEGHLLTKS